MKPFGPRRHTGRNPSDFIGAYRAVAAAAQSSIAVLEQLVAHEEEFLSRATALAASRLDRLLANRWRDIDALHEAARKNMRKPGGMCTARFLDKMVSVVEPLLQRIQHDAKLKFESAARSMTHGLLLKLNEAHLARQKCQQMQLDTLMVHAGQLEAIANLLEASGTAATAEILAAARTSMVILTSIPQDDEVPLLPFPPAF